MQPKKGGIKKVEAEERGRWEGWMWEAVSEEAGGLPCWWEEEGCQPTLPILASQRPRPKPPGPAPQ